MVPSLTSTWGGGNPQWHYASDMVLLTMVAKSCTFSTHVDEVVDLVLPGEGITLVTPAETLWKNCSEALQERVSGATWNMLFGQAEARSLQGDELVVTVPSSLIKDRIEAKYIDLVNDVVNDMSDRQLSVSLYPAIQQGQLLEEDIEDPAPYIEFTPSAPTPHQAQQAQKAPQRPEHISNRPIPAPPRPSQDSPLNWDYTFENFVIGASNRFAHAAALSVAESPAKSYNPLFIHGDAGLGKTHLLHAIGNYVRENFPHRHVHYVSTERMLNEFVESIRTNTGAAFRQRYRECDVLLIDDIQFMKQKEGLQEEFFHTFNHLYGASKQIVISSDRHPKSLVTLEERIRSRFLSGLTTDVQPPDLETRIAILRKKADGLRTRVPDNVLEFIASRVTDNIRELEGALIRVSAYSNLHGEQLTVETAEVVLADLVGTGDKPKTITPKDILAATAEMFGFTVEELCGSSRRRPLVTARQIGMYVFREVTDFSYPAIAREFGGRDHTTVIHAVDKITAMMFERGHIFNQVTALMHRVKAGES